MQVLILTCELLTETKLSQPNERDRITPWENDCLVTKNNKQTPNY